MNSYYKNKAKDSEQQAVYLLWLVIIAVALGPWYCTYKWLTHKCPEPFTKKLVIEQVIEIQKQVGCKMIDGEVGPEFKRLVNAQCEIDKPEYFNKLAKPYFTSSGAPKD